MLYFLWWLLGCLLFLHFIYVCIKVLGLVKNQVGLGSTIVLVIGLISMAGTNKNESGSRDRELKRWNFNPDSTVQGFRNQKVVLENKSLLKINLHAVYGFRENKREPIPVSAISTLEGIGGGVKWVPVDIKLNTDSTGNKLKYTVSGIIEWKLINLTLRYENKTYEGEFAVKW